MEKSLERSATKDGQDGGVAGTQTLPKHDSLFLELSTSLDLLPTPHLWLLTAGACLVLKKVAFDPMPEPKQRDNEAF